MVGHSLSENILLITKETVGKMGVVTIGVPLGVTKDFEKYILTFFQILFDMFGLRKITKGKNIHQSNYMVKV